MTPVSFDGCLGWLHSDGGSSRGVVICPGGDYEALSIHQTFRVLADRIAAAGLPTLRFDYPGTGDSLDQNGSNPGAAVRVAAIRSAIRFLIDQAGVSEVALVGWRLSAAWALEALDGSLPVESCALIRPTLRGKSHVVEQRALASVLAHRQSPDVRLDRTPGVIDIEGFRLTPTQIAEIAAIDLTAWSGPTPARALIMGEPGAQRYAAFTQHLAQRGVAAEGVELREVTGWVPNPIPQQPPLVDIDAIAAWLAKGAEPRAAAPVAAGVLATPTFEETALAFGRDGELMGVLCEPRATQSEAPREVTIFITTGANAHIGPGRTFVEHCRALAEHAMPTFRMDLFGVGDSGWRPEGSLDSIHRLERIADISAAIDMLWERGFRAFRLIGVCSGGFLGPHAAVRDPRLSSVLIANPQFLSPPAPETLADPTQGTFAATSTYVRKLASPELWRRALTGQISGATLIGAPREIFRRKVRSLRSGLARRLGGPATHRSSDETFLGALRALKARGCRIRLLMSASDPSREVFALETAGIAPEALRELIEVRILEGADHAFVSPHGRATFLAELLDAAEPAAQRPAKIA